MKSDKRSIVFISISICCVLNACNAQKPFGTDQFVAEKSVLMPDVKGRTDHMDIDQKEQGLRGCAW